MAGMVCFFVRLTGCNLRCEYCDTARAYEPAEDVELDSIVQRCAASQAPMIEVTGGEPLLQQATAGLLGALCRLPSRIVLLETNGSQDISVVPDEAIVIMDVKCPGSGEAGSFDMANIRRLRPRDEVKFVLRDKADYDWAVEFMTEAGLVSVDNTILFSPISGVLDPSRLAEWLLEDRLSVRMQLQLHKVLGLK